MSHLAKEQPSGWDGATWINHVITLVPILFADMDHVSEQNIFP